MRVTENETPPEGWQAGGGAEGTSGDCSQDNNTTHGHPLKPDLSQAERFLTLLDEEADSFTFQVFADNKELSVRAEHRSGSFDDLKAWLTQMNQRGAGVFVTVNETDGAGRSKRNIQRIRAIWQEADNGDEQAWPLEPHITVMSSPGKHHRYVLTDGAPLDEFEPVQRCMVDKYGSDPDAKDRARVMRLPGFFHQKDPDNPHMVEIVLESGEKPYAWETVKQHFPPVDMRPRGQAPAPGSVDAPELERILSFIPNNDVHYADWLRVGMALHHETGGDDTGFQLWRNWSAKSDKFDDSDMWDKWESFGKHDSVVTIGTLIWIARKNGYTDSVSTIASRLASTIQDTLCTELHIDPEASPETVLSLGINATAIDRMLNRSFWSGSKGKLFILNDAHGVNQYTERDAWGFLSRSCGAVADRDAVYNRALAIHETLSPGPQKKEAARIAAIPRNVIMDELKWRNQRDHTQWRVDMFAGTPRLELREDAARITLPHVPFPDYGDPAPEVIADYRAHFPELDDVILMITAARFAGDRKKAYLWLLASSDWGKGFFTACLQELGLVVEMSVKEIERVFEGLPAGRRPEEFKRAWVLGINEFKSVKAEIKQLESTMQISPKNQLTSEVELFAKLFMSAENVASLVTDHGVEDQFVQRFSLIDKRGAIDGRPLFNQDTGAYRRAVVAYLARKINQQVSEYQRMGRDEADRQATAALRQFHDTHGLGNFATRFSESMEEIAGEFRTWIDTHGAASPNKVSCGTPERLYLRNATKELDDFLHRTKPSDQVPTIKRRKDDIFRYVSADGKGYASHTVDGQSLKAVRLK